MKIDVSHLDDRKEIRHKYADFDLEDEELQLKEQPEIDLVFQRQSDGVHASGKVKATVEAFCDRCLAPVPVGIDGDFNLVYLPLSAAPVEAGEHEIVEDHDFDLAYFESDEGQVIDVDALVREQVQLGMPVHSLCNPDCKGLCPTCGIDLNTGSCN